MKQIFLFLLLIASGAALAANTPNKLDQLKAELSRVREEQQSAYQDYQMIMELRRNEVQERSPFMLQHPYGMSMDTPPPNYDDVLRAQQEREEQILQHTSELKRLAARYLELEDQRKSLLKQILELERNPDK